MIEKRAGGDLPFPKRKKGKRHLWHPEGMNPIADKRSKKGKSHVRRRTSNTLKKRRMGSTACQKGGFLPAHIERKGGGGRGDDLSEWAA